MADIADAKRIVAAGSREGARLLGAGVSKPCYQGRYNIAAQAALADSEAGFTTEERQIIAAFIAEEGEESETRDMFIRNLDVELYRGVKAQAALQGLAVGEAVNRAMALWLGIEERIER